MDHEQEKIKHSRRRQQKQNHIQRQATIAKAFGIPEAEKHRFAKRNALNCGNPKCLLCSNPRKVWHELTIQEQRHFQELEIERNRHGNGLMINEREW